MKSVRLRGGKQIDIVNVPSPSPGPGEVVVETEMSALCGSELHAYREHGVETGNSGHEAVGTIVEIGEGVRGLSVGQRVGAHAIAGCGRCAQCDAGRFTWCRDFRFYGSMHSERFVVASSSCYILPDDVPSQAAVLLTGDGFGVPYHTSTKIDSSDIQTVAVFGAGPIGLGNIVMQRFLGRRVIAVDMSQTRLELARSLGAETVDAGGEESSSGAVRRLTGGNGADVCIEAAGVPQTAYACFEAVRTAGTVVFNGEQGDIALSPSNHFIRRDITAIGSWFYHYAEIDPMIGLYREGVPITSIISHRFKSSDAAEAYETFAERRSGKVMLDWR